MSVLGFDRDAYRRGKLHRLERENGFLRGEHDRLSALLADALAVAAGQGRGPTVLLEALADERGMNLARAAIHDVRNCAPEPESAIAEPSVDELVQLLRETAP